MAEEGQKHRKPEGAFFRFGATRSHIRAVADGREHIEADAQRQDGGECRQQPGRNRVERLRGKARVPEPAQHSQIQHRQQGQQRPFVGQPPQPEPAQPVDANQQHKDGSALQPRPSKEQQAEHIQHQIAQTARTHPVDRQRKRQKNEQKLHR